MYQPQVPKKLLGVCDFRSAEEQITYFSECSYFKDSCGQFFSWKIF